MKLLPARYFLHAGAKDLVRRTKSCKVWFKDVEIERKRKTNKHYVPDNTHPEANSGLSMHLFKQCVVFLEELRILFKKVLYFNLVVFWGHAISIPLYPTGMRFSL